MHSGEKHTPACMIHRHSCALALLIVKLEFWSPKADPSTTSRKPKCWRALLLAAPCLLQCSGAWETQTCLKVVQTICLEIQNTDDGFRRAAWRKRGSPNTWGYKMLTPVLGRAG